MSAVALCFVVGWSGFGGDFYVDDVFGKGDETPGCKCIETWSSMPEGQKKGDD